MGLDETAKQLKYKVVLFIDEFQQIGELKNNTVIEAAIRNAAQYAENTTYIFAGSNRHLLARMFEDPERPFYSLVDKLILGRISAADYRKYLQIAAKKRWKKDIDQKIIDNILLLTQCHAYYVNLLCNHIWYKATLPTLKTTEQTWEDCYHIEKGLWIDYLNRLSRNQLAVVIGLASEPTKQPTSDKYLTKLGLKKGSAWKALREVQAEDIIEKDKSGFYRVLNPMIQTVVQKHFL